MEGSSLTLRIACCLVLSAIIVIATIATTSAAGVGHGITVALMGVCALGTIASLGINE